MKKIIIIIFSFLLTFHVSAKPKLKMNQNIESWYFNVALGYASASYYDELQELIDIIEENSDSRLGINFDIGFYWPLQDRKSLLGGSLNGAGDRFEYTGSNGWTTSKEWAQINQYLIGPSFIYYATDYIGRGLFLRADLGLGYAVLDGSNINSESTDTGFGYLIGCGWSLPINNQTRINLLVDYSGKTIKEESFYALTFNFGFMF